MDKFLQIYKLPKPNQGKTGNMNRPITSMNIETVIKNSQQKPRARWLHRWTLPKVWKKANTYIAQTLQENCRGRKTHSMRRPDTKSRQTFQKKERKLQANITDEHRRKNSQQSSSKQNPGTHKKDHTSWSNELYRRDARIFQYQSVNQCDIPY